MALLGIPDEAEGPPAGGVPEPGAPAAQAGPGMDAMPLSARDDGIPFGKRLAVRTAKRLINEVAATAKARTVVEKVGRRMAKSRLERFKSALRVFADLLSELDVSAKAAPPPPAKKPGAAPPAAACKTDAEKAELSREIAEKNAEIAALRKAVAPGGSNALSVESTPEPAREPRWSLDMGNDTRPKFGDVLDVPL